MRKKEVSRGEEERQRRGGENEVGRVGIVGGEGEGDKEWKGKGR